MKIAILTFHNPIKPVSGYAVRVNNLIKILAQHHEVIALVRSRNDRVYDHDGIKVVEISSKITAIYPFSPFYFAKCYRFLRKTGCDLMIAEGAINILHVHLLSSFLGCKSIYDAHNVDSLNYFRIARSRPNIWIFYYFMELLAGLTFDKISFVSNQDLELYTKIFRFRRATLSVIPNGVDCERFLPKTTSNANTCLFFGSFRYAPNIEAFNYIVDLATKLPTVNFVIAGEGSDTFKHDEEKLDNLKFLGEVSDIVQTIQNSTCVVVPLLKGSGTRLKILESMACGRPVITTPKGAEGLNVNNEKDLIICDLDLFDKNILQLVNDTKKQSQISIAAREKVLREYDWKGIGDKLLAVVRD